MVNSNSFFSLFNWSIDFGDVNDKESKIAKLQMKDVSFVRACWNKT
jgi:hypothetical protein